MMRFLKSMTLTMVGAFLLGAAALPAFAADKKLIGIVIKIDLAEDGASAVATLKSKGKKVPIAIDDELTLNKFKIKKIQVGDEIRCTYEEKDETKHSLTFKRTAGC